MKKLHKNSSLLPIIAVVMMSLFTGTMKAQVDVMTIKGASVTVKGPTLVDKAPDTKPNIFVGGDVTNDAGAVDNDGEFQFTGNYLLNNGATHTSTGDDITIGGNGTPDATYNKLLQRISGNSTSGLVGTYGFYNFVIQKPAWSGTSDSRVELGINVDAANSIAWTGTGGIIRTDISSHTTNGSSYSYFINLKNGATNAMSGYSWTTVPQWSNTGGATDKYVEGKLQRAVTVVGTYQFPIGVEPTSLDGMEGAEVSFTSTPSNTLLGYVQPATNPSLLADLPTNGDIQFYDVGSLPGTSPANQFPNCVGTQDGHDDIAVIDQADQYEWIFTLGTGATVAYTLRVHPGPIMDPVAYVTMGAPCSSPFQKAKYLARNGKIGGDQAVGPTINYWNPGVTGYYQKPTGNILTGQTGFSRFRLFGTTDPMNTSLPVELLTFTVSAVNNEYLHLDWATASELNNAGFAIERSKNGNGGWVDIAWVPGNGTTNTVHRYGYDDKTVSYDTTYYYRLRQTDISGKFNYSWILSGKLIGSNTKPFSFSPNPTTNGIVTLYNRNGSKIILYDVLGKLVKTIPVMENQFDVSELANGTYYMKVIDTNDESQTYKLLKIK